jgi:anti-sigma factor ChrR (cupin superfamily)
MLVIGSTPPTCDVLLLSADSAIIHSGVAATTIRVMVEDNIAVAAVAAEVLCNIMRWLLLGWKWPRWHGCACLSVHGSPTNLNFVAFDLGLYLT